MTLANFISPSLAGPYYCPIYFNCYSYADRNLRVNSAATPRVLTT
jgi:hypothetical protein